MPKEKKGKLAMNLGYIFEKTLDKGLAFTRLAQWHDKVEKSGFESCGTVSHSIQAHYQTVIKAFRVASRGVRDIKFFLFRLTKIYA